MAHIKVSWEIDFETEDLVENGEKVLNTEMAKKAAELALKYITDPDTEARVFNVETNGEVFEVDLVYKEIRIKPYKKLSIPY